MKELKEFNDRYKGKEINWCDLWWKTINFNPEEATFCCSSTLGWTPGIVKLNGTSADSFDKETFVKETIRLITESQNECKKGCYGCARLGRAVAREISYDNIKITNVSWNHFRGCNSLCVYCGDGGKPIHVYYEAKKILEKLLEENIVDEKVTISFGGGEPTLVPNLQEYIEMGREKGWKQFLNTNALLYKEYVTEALRDPNFSVQISVDSGTPETYRKIKGQDGFERVWKTIRKYCEVGGVVFVKYIVFSWNSSKREIDSFISKMLVSGGRNISISGESGIGWGINECEWEFGKREIDGCVYLMEKALENGFAIYLYRGNFSNQDCEMIVSKFVNEYVKPIAQKDSLYIWGMGEYGRRLADALCKNGVEVNGFGDRDNQKWGSAYRGISCISLSDLIEEIGDNQAYVFIALEQYESAYEELKKYANLKISVINLT